MSNTYHSFNLKELIKKARTIQNNSYFIISLILALTMSFIGCCHKLNQKQPNIPNGGRAVAVATNPIDDLKMVVASETGGLFRTANGGDNWTHVSGSTTFRYRDVIFLPTDANIVIAAANMDSRIISGGGIYHSTNGGVSWSKATMNAPSTDCANDMAAHCLSFDASNSRLWAGTDCGLFYSDDNGVNWNYLTGAVGLGNGSVRAVVTPSANHMVVLTENSIKVSTDGGNNWTLATNGLPGNRAAGQHNQIAVSSKNDQHIYFAFNFWEYNSDAGKWESKNALYYTQDYGNSWSEIVKQNGWNRPPFVVLSRSALGGGNNKIDLYYSNGGCQLRKREVVHGSTVGFNPWSTINSDHCDAADLGFSIDGKTPILLLSDGGVHKTIDNGANWTMTGAGLKGYAALQITEVTGQKTDDDGKADLYFGTQDNDNWASPDYGATWPGRRCCEGFYLNVPRASISASATTHTGVSCAGCGNYKSKPVLTNQSGWNNPPRNVGNPALISPSKYVQVQYNADSTAYILARSTNTGGNWTSTITINEEIKNLPLVVGSASNPVIYLAIKKPGTTNGAQNIGLRRVSGILGSTYSQSEITGFGNIGIFPTMFAWYEVFGVKPSNPNFIIVPDISNDVVKKSLNGGSTWVQDNNLTNLVTNSGEFKFHWKRFSQISCFGFDPECINHIMVGTQQAGIFQSFDNGKSWEKVPGSQFIPYVSSFFFPKKGEVVISSYGRGLWRFRYKCLPSVILPPIFPKDWPVLWFKDLPTPLGTIVVDNSCTKCGFFLIRGGSITDVVVDTVSDKVKEIFIDKGNFKGYSLDGHELEIPIKVSLGKGGNGIIANNKKLAKILEGKYSVKGIYLNDNLYNGIIINDTDINPKNLPKIEHPLPSVRLKGDNDLGMSMEAAQNIVILGQGFNSKFPVEIIMDGKRIEIKEQPHFDEKGNFRLTIPPIFGIGNHTLLIRQKTDRGIIEDTVDIRITVQDFPEEKQ